MGAVKSHCPKTRRPTGCVFYIASLTLLGISVAVPIFFESWPHLHIPDRHRPQIVRSLLLDLHEDREHDREQIQNVPRSAV
jgi:hypothetical protein